MLKSVDVRKGAGMRVSQIFGLSGTQGVFDFIDVDVSSDTALFIDPAVIASINSPWANSCAATVQNYFQEVLDRIVAGKDAEAKELLSHLGEDNSTHLGYSDKSRGSAVGKKLAKRFYNELSTSKAVSSGLITDLEDTALLIEGVREDRISDVVTNVIRNQLIEFTQQTAMFYGIPLQPGVAVGPYWDIHVRNWKLKTFDLPITAEGPLILVPKAIVRRTLFLNPDEYYRHYILEYFRQEELNDPKSSLVYLIKSGEKRVRKGDVEDKVREKNRGNGTGIEKRVNVDGTQHDPSLIEQYKSDKGKEPPAILPHETLSEVTGTEPPDLDKLLESVRILQPGDQDAHKYEKAVEALLSALMYPSLSNPVRQEKIHEGRKIIDITFTNTGGRRDFFGWLANNYPAATIVVECKNYSRPISNPEYDQISGRFSPSRGKYGLLVYRSIEDKNKMFESCKDTARDDRGFITALDDDDLSALVAEAHKLGTCFTIGGILYDRFKGLIS